MIDVKEFLSV